MSRQYLQWIINKNYEQLFSISILNDIVSGKHILRESVVREVLHRKVIRLTIALDACPRLYCKSFSLASPKILKIFLPSRGQVEWNVAHVLGKRKIPTYTPIALGLKKRWWFTKESYLLTKEIPNCKTLKTFSKEYSRGIRENSEQFRKKFIKNLAAFIRTVHQAGIIHQDLHWGNILVQNNAEGPCSFYLIDLHRIKIKRFVTMREKLKNLALLNTAFYAGLSERDQIRFLRQYFKEESMKRKTFCYFRDTIKLETRKLLISLWQKRDSRCIHENKYFARIRINGLKGFISAAYAAGRYPEAILKKPDILFLDSNTTIIKESHTTSSLVSNPGSQHAGFYLKRFNYKGFWYIVKNLCRSSRAKKVWQAANSLIIRGVATPRPLLYLEKRICRVLLNSYFLTEPVPNAMTLQTYVDRNITTALLKEKNAMIRLLALTIRNMHLRGIQHGDLKANNILIQVQPQDTIKIFFIDLDAVRTKNEIGLQEKVRDLGRLNCSFLHTGRISRTHRLRFLKYYLGRGKKNELKKHWSAVIEWTNKKLLQSERSFF